jgi:hypothetical protein
MMMMIMRYHVQEWVRLDDDDPSKGERGSRGLCSLNGMAHVIASHICGTAYKCSAGYVHTDRACL